MTNFAVFHELMAVDIPLENIFLDPNNPRFVATDWVYISDDQIDNSEIQEAVQLRMVQHFGVDKLRMNMEINGYLPIDRVVVREFAQDKYVVLEGNRRICAAKRVSRVALDGSNVPHDVLDSLKIVPCLQYTGTDTNAAWIFQGIRHITGISEWSGFNKAKLLVEQMENDDLSLTEVGKRFGLTAYGAGQWARGYFAFKQAREESDYVNDVDERSYPYFQELFSRSNGAMRRWLEWNEQERKFLNLLNFNEFVSWLYPKPYDGSDKDFDALAMKGDWERRYINRSDDIRSLSYLLSESPTEFEQFRQHHEIERAYSFAQQRKYEEEAKQKEDVVAKVFDAIQLCTKSLDDIPYKAIRDDTTKARLFEALDKLEAVIKTIK